MPQEKKIFHTSISSQLKKRKLFRGTLLSGCGVLLLVVAGTQLPPPLLKQWGVLLFFFGFFVIALGLIPYRLLTKLEASPHQLVVTSSGKISYFRKGKKVWEDSLKHISSFQFLEQGEMYGVEANVSGKPVFFPYFSKRTAAELSTLLEEVNPD